MNILKVLAHAKQQKECNMKFTNELNYPAPLYNALVGENYDLINPPLNVFSVTRLIGSPKIAELERRHWDEIVVPAESRVWVLLGNAMHKVLEEACRGEMLTEERWFLNMTTGRCFTLSAFGSNIKDCEWYNTTDIFITGKIDLYDAAEKTLYDFKQTSIFTWLLNNKEPKIEWVQQLNLNAFGIKKTGFEVKKLKIIAFYKDHNAKKHAQEGIPYPIHIIDLPVYSNAFTEDFVGERVMLHKMAQDMPDDETPVCTPEERWTKPTTWAIMKDGRKSALRIHDTEEQAQIHLSQCDMSCRVEERPGTDTRCTGYCNATQWCNYYQENYANKQIEETVE